MNYCHYKLRTSYLHHLNWPGRYCLNPRFVTPYHLNPRSPIPWFLNQWYIFHFHHHKYFHSFLLHFSSNFSYFLNLDLTHQIIFDLTFHFQIPLYFHPKQFHPKNSYHLIQHYLFTLSLSNFSRNYFVYLSRLFGLPFHLLILGLWN